MKKVEEGTIRVRFGSEIVELSDVSEDLIQRKISDVLKTHKCICESCDSRDCIEGYTIENDIIVRAIETHDELYVFDCLAYHRRRLVGRKYDREYIGLKPAEKYCMAFHASLPDNSVNETDSVSALIDAFVDEHLAAEDELERLYGSLLAEIDEPVVLYRRRRSARR